MDTDNEEVTLKLTRADMKLVLADLQITLGQLKETDSEWEKQLADRLEPIVKEAAISIL